MKDPLLIVLLAFLFLPKIGHSAEASTKIFFLPVTPNLIWTDKGSGGDQDMAIYRPVKAGDSASPSSSSSSSSSSAWVSLGDMAFPTYSSPYEAGVVFSTDLPGVFARPLGFEQVWNDRGSGANQDGSVWQMNCPEGYVALGLVANPNHQPPPLEAASCVHQNYTTPHSWEEMPGRPLWSDHGSGADSDLTIFKIRQGRELPQETEGETPFYLSTFKAHRSHNFMASLSGPHYRLNNSFYALLERATKDSSSPTSTEMVCNGSKTLCQRPYNQVAYMTTHNSMANEEDYFAFPNQTHSMSKQFANGVRGLMLDTHYFLGQSYLCHGSCVIGARLLVDGFKEIARFLETHPHEVVTIIFEDGISKEDTSKALIASGLMGFSYLHDPAKGWPTLKEMIDSNQRLVLFTDVHENPHPWTLHIWNYNSETDYNLKSKDDMTCEINRGNSKELIILNHFLTNIIGAPQFAIEVNNNPFLSERIQQCRQEWQKIPNFITVDFYHLGDVKSVVENLNQ